jgi:DNA-binding response OmpR family regulator
MSARTIKRVVVADDEPDIADLITMQLQLHGYEVQTVFNGRDARDAVVRTLPDLVVLDRMMPKMDGLEVLSVLKSNPATLEIPVVMLTAMASDSDVWDGWQTGADYYLTKPFDFEELLRYITFLDKEANLLV